MDQAIAGVSVIGASFALVSPFFKQSRIAFTLS